MAANTELCQSLGADEMIDYTQASILESGKEFDVFFDVFGNYSFETGKTHPRPEGHIHLNRPSSRIMKDRIRTLFTAQKAKLVIVKSNARDLEWLANDWTQGRSDRW